MNYKKKAIWCLDFFILLATCSSIQNASKHKCVESDDDLEDVSSHKTLSWI